MASDYLHGVQVVSVDDGVRQFQTVDSAIVGICGTAPDAESSVSASLTVGSDNSQLTFTAATPGEDGNNISVIMKNNGASQSLQLNVTDNVLTISLATDESGVITSTASEIVTAVTALTEPNDIVTATAGGTGAGVVLASYQKYLTGGADEAFPLNTPVSVTPSSKQLSRLGTSGTLYEAISVIQEQADAVMIVVRVAEGADDDETATNARGTLLDRTGVYALLNAEAVTNLKPQILCAPGFTQVNTVKQAILNVAERLGGFAYVDAPDTTSYTDALSYAGDIDNQFGKACWPRFNTDVTGSKFEAWQSALWTGIRVAVDNDSGFWVSESNKSCNGVLSLKTPVDFSLGDTTSLANILNAGNVATLIRQSGFRTWGNRTLSKDSKWQFATIVRMYSLVGQSLQAAHLYAVDKNIVDGYHNAVSANVNAYLRKLINKGALVGAQNVSQKINCCIPNAELNTAEAFENGEVYFDVYLTGAYPAERITFRLILNNNGLSTILGG